MYMCSILRQHMGNFDQQHVVGFSSHSFLDPMPNYTQKPKSNVTCP